MYGAIPVKAGLSVHETGEGKVRTTRIVFDGMEVTIADNPAVTAFGSQKIYDFAEGVVNILGSRADITRVERTVGTATTGIFDAFDATYGVGTVAADNTATLTTTEQNIVPSTAAAQAVLGVSAGAKNLNVTAAGAFDGSVTAVDLFLNAVIQDTDHAVDVTPSNLKFWGEVVVTWIDVGDK